jgi:hypothetical protein
MARRVSLRPIVTQIHRAERAARKVQKKAPIAQVKKLTVKLRKLAKVESSVRAICRGFYI